MINIQAGDKWGTLHEKYRGLSDRRVCCFPTLRITLAPITVSLSKRLVEVQDVEAKEEEMKVNDKTVKHSKLYEDVL